jgi:hypothetical protein
MTDSKKEICNQLSKFICNKLYSNKFKTMISVCDVGNFYIIKGITENEINFNVNEIVNEFCLKFKNSFKCKDISKINTIDLIEYKMSNDFENSISIKFLRDFNEHTDDLNPIIVSDIIFGLSDNYMKKVINYLKHISFNVQSYFRYSFIEFNVTFNESEGIININEFNTDSYYPNEKLLSIILDNFSMKVDDIGDDWEIINNNNFYEII